MSEPIANLAKVYLYPVKSMAGIGVREAHIGLDGILGDRQYAFVLASVAATKSFPWMTARQDSRMVCYQPLLEELPNSTETETPVRVRTPEGRITDISDRRLLEELQTKFGRELFLLRNERGMFDCQHVSAFNLATVDALAKEAESAIDHRQFRANLYFTPICGQAFVEEQWTGCLWSIGPEALLSVAQTDHRCMMVNLCPETGRSNPQVLSVIARLHENQAGLYFNVVRPGKIREGDSIRRIPINA